MTHHTLRWRSHRLELGPETRIMGVLNVTPDSFSDGGKFFSTEKAVDHGERLVGDGADILDVGGESTRPYAESVSENEEIRRVAPVIEALAKRVSVPISIDTTKSEVARAALSAGAAMINDVSAFRLDPELADVAAQAGVPVILMHMKGDPRTMQLSPTYDDLLAEITTYLKDRVAYAEAKGIDRSSIIIDPGIGFGKTAAHNFQIIKGLSVFKKLKLPILVGSSRKAFIRKTVGDPNISPQAPEVETGSQAAVSAAALYGAHIVRVHNVANTRTTLKIIDAIRSVC